MTERETNGQFKKGHSGNPNGRPKKQREDRYYEILMNVCTFADWKAIGKKAVEQAKGGDKDARKWLTDYLIGPAPKRLEHTGEGGGPIKGMATLDLSNLTDAELDVLIDIANKFEAGKGQAASD